MSQAIELRHLRYFVAVAEELNVRRAAERLHIAQPPLSRQIQQLESLLDAELFERRKTGMALTAAGSALLPEARGILGQLEHALASVRSARALEAGKFVVGYPTIFDPSALPDVFDVFRRRFPTWRHVLKGGHSISHVRALRSATMDVAFITVHTEAKGLEVEVVRDEPAIVALPSRHRLATKRWLALHDLRSVPLFWFERKLNPGYYDHCEALFEAEGFAPKRIPEPDDHHILLGQIAAGQGVAFLPASMQAVRRSGVTYRPFKKGARVPSMGLALAYDASNPSPLLRPFIEQVRRRG